MNISHGPDAGTRFLDVDGGRLAYEVAGAAQAPLIVAVHGMGDSRQTFRFLAPLLVAAGYRVAALDVRGHGDSSTGWADHGYAAVGGDVLALMDHLGADRATLIGNSSGAGAIGFTAALAPQRIERIVMLATFASEAKLNLFLRAALGLVLRSPSLWTVYFGSLFKDYKPADLKDYQARMRARLRRPGRMAAVPALIAPTAGGERNRHWTEIAAQVTCPVLIVHGTKDPDYPDPEAEARLAQSLLPDARIRMVDGAGHYPQVERPELVAGMITEFSAGSRAWAGLSADAIVDVALTLLDEQGAEPAFAAVAARSGVAPPSLYKHVRNAADLRGLIGRRILAEFGDELSEAIMGRSGDEAVTELMLAWRRYVLAHPHRYTMMSLQPLTDPALAETGRRLLQAIVAVLSAYGLTGADAVHAARRLRAAAHGFVVLEAQGGFGLPQEIDVSYRQLIAMVIASLRPA